MEKADATSLARTIRFSKVSMRDVVSIGVALVLRFRAKAFVPNKFNSLIVFSDAARGDCKLGVCFDKDYGKYRARCKSQISGRVEDLGCFDDEDEAHEAWKSKRLDIAKRLKGEMDAIDDRIYNGIVSHIINAK